MPRSFRPLFYLGIIAIMGCGKGTILPAVSYVCPANRFITTQFIVNAPATVTYTQATDYTGKAVNLSMDVYQPDLDTLARRPLIIYVHGGNFTSGSRTNAWPVKFCQQFAKRGYVTASIDYRLGIGPNGDADVISAQVRAVQDAKAAVRYLKQTAAEAGNPYRIDTAQIYVAGESTGAMIALQMAYLTSEAQFAAIGNVTLLQGLNGIEGNPTLVYSSSIKGAISLSGAILDLDWIANPNLPLIMVHGSKDTLIPFKSGIASPYTMTTSYGSYLIDSTANARSLNVALHTFAGVGATPYITSTTYADSTINYVSQEMVGLINCQSLGVK